MNTIGKTFLPAFIAISVAFVPATAEDGIRPFPLPKGGAEGPRFLVLASAVSDGVAVSPGALHDRVFGALSPLGGLWYFMGDATLSNSADLSDPEAFARLAPVMKARDIDYAVTVILTIPKPAQMTMNGKTYDIWTVRPSLAFRVHAASDGAVIRSLTLGGSSLKSQGSTAAQAIDAAVAQAGKELEAALVSSRESLAGIVGGGR